MLDNMKCEKMCLCIFVLISPRSIISEFGGLFRPQYIKHNIDIIHVLFYKTKNHTKQKPPKKQQYPIYSITLH